MSLRRNRFTTDLTENDVTPEALFKQRRHFIKAGAGSALAASLSPWAMALEQDRFASAKNTYTVDAPLNSYDDISSYNNFYELGLGKGDPERNADKLITDPWSVTVEGLCNKPGTLDLDELLKPHEFEERIYRFRCVEAWSMVIPWVRMDEAMNPLSFMATGLYGKALPNQNGAPLRLVVPWKYGFKSIKSIVKIRIPM